MTSDIFFIGSPLPIGKFTIFQEFVSLKVEFSFMCVIPRIISIFRKYMSMGGQMTNRLFSTRLRGGASYKKAQVPD